MGVSRAKEGAAGMRAVPAALDRAETWVRAHRGLAWGFVALACLPLLIQIVIKGQGDFSISYDAGLGIWTGGTVYDASELIPYLYSPFYALLISPISWAGHLFGYTLSKALFAGLSIGCFVATLLLLRRVLDETPGAPIPGWVIAVPVFLSLRLILNNFQHGQVNLIILFCVFGAWELVRRERPLAAALCILPALASKLVLPLVFVGYFAVRGQLRFVAAVAVLMAAAFATPALVTGWERNLELHYQWFDLMPFVAEQPHHQESFGNQSALGVALRLFRDTSEGPAHLVRLEPWVPRAVFLVVTVGMGVLAGLAALFHRGRNGQPRNLVSLAEFSLLYGVMAMASPLSWKHYFSYWFVPLSLLCLAVARGHPGARIYTALMALVLVFVSLPSRSIAGAELAGTLQVWGTIFWANGLVWLCVLHWLWTPAEPEERAPA